MPHRCVVMRAGRAQCKIFDLIFIRFASTTKENTAPPPIKGGSLCHYVADTLAPTQGERGAVVGVAWNAAQAHCRCKVGHDATPFEASIPRLVNSYPAYRISHHSCPRLASFVMSSWSSYWASPSASCFSCCSLLPAGLPPWGQEALRRQKRRLLPPGEASQCGSQRPLRWRTS